MKRYRAWLEVALAAAEEAGAYIRQAWRTEHVVLPKGYRDIVTTTDTAVERIILKHIRAAFPDHAVTSEEAGADEAAAEVRWLVDPLDGTTNFTRNNPNFSSAIAALEAGEPVVGVVFDPLRTQAFAAYAGGGATLNGDPIQVSDVADVSSAILAVDTPKDANERRQMWTYVGRFLRQGRTLRALGSAALNLAYVAAGWVDGYFSVHMKPWDQAAGALLVREAGGVVATVSGDRWTAYRPDPLVTATPELMIAMRRLLGGA
ncbi:MAG: inositol monophosphatase family protein [Anaerolineae bacterium]